MPLSLLCLVAITQPKAEFLILEPLGTALNRMQDPVRQISIRQMTDDGRFIVGTSTGEGHQGMVWEVGKRAYFLDKPEPIGHYWANAVSGDGRTFGGAAIWTQPGTPLHRRYGKTLIPKREIGLARQFCDPYWINHDGTQMSFEVWKPGDLRRGFVIIVGKSKIPVVFSDGAFVNGGIRDLTPDGRKGVGVHRLSKPGILRAFVWSSSSRKARQLPLPKGWTSSEALSISNDGRTIFGALSHVQGLTARHANGTWDARGRFTALPVSGESLGYMSQDGRVFCFTAPDGKDCLLWTKRGGRKSLRALLTKHGAELDLEILSARAVAVQANHVTVAGQGSNPSCIWVARIPKSALL